MGKRKDERKLEAQRIAYITNKLDLSSEESIKFWPVYNEYSKKDWKSEKKPGN